LRLEDGETLKQRRERIKREEEAQEEGHDAPPEVEQAFALFDQDEDGSISKADLAFVAKQIGTQVAP
jgi:Ca2+-binding EF-hand superfamily protein